MVTSLVLVLGLLLTTPAFAQSPEELTLLKQILAVSEETELGGLNILRLSRIPQKAPINVYVGVGLSTVIYDNLVRELLKANESYSELEFKRAEEQKKIELDETIPVKRDRPRQLERWRQTWKPTPIFRVVRSLNEADIVLSRVVLVSEVSQRITSSTKEVMVWDLGFRQWITRPVQQTSSVSEVPVFGYILRVQDQGNSLAVIHRYQSTTLLVGESSQSGIQLVEDLVKLVESHSQIKINWVLAVSLP